MEFEEVQIAVDGVAPVAKPLVQSTNLNFMLGFGSWMLLKQHQCGCSNWSIVADAWGTMIWRSRDIGDGQQGSSPRGLWRTFLKMGTDSQDKQGMSKIDSHVRVNSSKATATKPNA